MSDINPSFQSYHHSRINVKLLHQLQQKKSYLIPLSKQLIQSLNQLRQIQFSIPISSLSPSQITQKMEQQQLKLGQKLIDNQIRMDFNFQQNYTFTQYQKRILKLRFQIQDKQMFFFEENQISQNNSSDYYPMLINSKLKAFLYQQIYFRKLEDLLALKTYQQRKLREGETSSSNTQNLSNKIDQKSIQRHFQSEINQFFKDGKVQLKLISALYQNIQYLNQKIKDKESQYEEYCKIYKLLLIENKSLKKEFIQKPTIQHQNVKKQGRFSILKQLIN